MKITGKFIYLRSINVLDSKFIYELRQNKINSFYLHKPPKSINDQKKWIEKNLINIKANDFIIFDKKKRKKIGTIAFDNISKKTAEWGRWISNGNTAQNIEAVILLLNHGFKKLKFKSIYSLTNVKNRKVINFHKSTTAKYLGTKKSFFFINKKKVNAAKYVFTINRFERFKKKFYVIARSVQ